VAGEPAKQAGEHAPGWLGDTLSALGAGRGGAPLVDRDYGDPGLLGLVGHSGDQVADAPVTDPPVMPTPSGQGQHATRITHRHSAGPLLECPADDHGGGFVLGLGHPAPVPRLDPALGSPVLAPAPRSPLTRPGSAAGSGPAPGLGKKPAAGPGGPAARRLTPSTHAHTSPAEISRPIRRRRWPRVSRSPARAVRYTTFGELGSRRLGMLPAHLHPLTKPPAQHRTPGRDQRRQRRPPGPGRSRRINRRDT
jgi:hypothetical protein